MKLTILLNLVLLSRMRGALPQRKYLFLHHPAKCVSIQTIASYNLVLYKQVQGKRQIVRKL
jgi:hypothetical protein